MQIGQATYDLTEDLIQLITVSDLSEYTGQVSKIIVEFVCLLATDEELIPGRDLVSHLELYQALNLAEALGIPRSELNMRLAAWPESPDWVKLKRADYLHALAENYPDLVDFDRFFREHPQPFAHVAAAIRLCADPEQRVQTAKFYVDYDFTSCFEGGNGETRSQVDILRKARNDAMQSVSLDPHDSVFWDPENPYWVSVESNEDVWSCEKIARAPRNTATPLICDRAEFNRRLSDFSFGVLDKTLTDPAWPRENVTIGGGSVMRLLSGDTKSYTADIDIFVHADTHSNRVTALGRVIAWFNRPASNGRPNVYYAVNGSVLSIYIKGVRRVFQIISIDTPSAYTVISHFDLSHILWGCQCVGGEWRAFGMPSAFDSMRSGVTRVVNGNRANVGRAIKAMYAGYSMSKNTTQIDLTALIAEPNGAAMNAIMRGFHAFYYPVDDLTMLAEDEHDYIVSMIEIDSKAPVVTSDPVTAAVKVVVGGSFDEGYARASVAQFNPSAIVNVATGRMLTLLRDARGIIRLSSGAVRVTNVNYDDGVVITATANADLIELAETLRGRVWEIFRGRQGPARPTNSVVNEGKVEFSVSKYSIDSHTGRGTTIITSQHGDPLNISEDIRIGDVIEVIFTINVTNSWNDKTITLKPVGFIKQVAETEEARPIVRALNVIPQDCSIEYE